jgi:competence protein ComEA
MATGGDPQGGLVERWGTRLRDAGCGPAEILALAVLCSGALVLLGVLWLAAATPPAGDTGLGALEPVALAEQEFVVHVAGRVVAPGLYRLPGGARVADALEAAGGALPDAVLDGLNLARMLDDGEQLSVPGRAADTTATADTTDAPAVTSAWRPDGTLDLNLATVADLEALPGIGPVLAQRIIDHREQAGRFRAVTDLRAVRGIGPKIFETLAPLVSV